MLVVQLVGARSPKIKKCKLLQSNAEKLEKMKLLDFITNQILNNELTFAHI